jgi:type I restriction enzyme M protein
VKVGKKTPLTLAHFGFAPDGSVLDDAGLARPAGGGLAERRSQCGQALPQLCAATGAARKPESRSAAMSWTVDFAARRAKAREDMQPYLLDQGRSDRPQSAHEAHEAGQGVERREAWSMRRSVKRTKVPANWKAKAAAIDAAVFDLKAVNPRVKVESDTRSPQEIVVSIAAHGRQVEAALARLSGLLAQ